MDRTGKWAFWALAILVFLAPVARAEEKVPPGNGWKKRFQGEGFATFYRDRAGKPVGEVAITGEMPYPPADVFAAVDAVESYPEFMPYMKFVKNLAASSVPGGYTEKVWFEYVCAPLVSCRYFTVRRTSVPGADGVFRIRWTLAEPKHRKKPGDPEVAADLPSLSGAVEMAENNGSWEFTPTGDGKRTRVLYILSSDPGGSLPSFVVNKSNTVALPRVWEAIVARIEKTKGK